MSKGENIFKRKDGRWEARYIKGYELSGKIKYGFCYGKTYREAKEKFPDVGSDIETAEGVGSVASIDVFSDTIKVKFPEKHALLTYTLDEVKRYG